MRYKRNLVCKRFYRRKTLSKENKLEVCLVSTYTVLDRQAGERTTKTDRFLYIAEIAQEQ